LNTELLVKTYLDPKTGFTSINELSRRTKVPVDQVKEYLQTQDVYTKHYPKIENFKRRRYFTPGIDKIWQCDLVFMDPEWAQENDGYKYINLVIDTFSKFLFAVPLRTKQAEEVIKSFEYILKKSKRKPEKIHSDKGSEYISVKTKEFFVKNNIFWYSTENETKAMICERVAKTLQQRMYKYLTHNSTNKWIDVLQDLVDNYNSSYHSSIRMTPIEASKFDNESKVYSNLYGEKSRLNQKKRSIYTTIFKLNDPVRTTRFGTKFDRGYKPTFAEEILYIDEILDTFPTTYKLRDFNDKPIKGSYYANELVKYNKQDEDYSYDYILKTRKSKIPGMIEAFVKWTGYPEVFNSWTTISKEEADEAVKKTFKKSNKNLERSRTKRHVSKAK